MTKDDVIVFQKRRPGRRPWPEHIPFKRVNAVVVNGALVEVFDAICALEGRRPHEVVHEAVRALCESRRNEPAVKRQIALLRRSHGLLRMLK